MRENDSASNRNEIINNARREEEEQKTNKSRKKRYIIIIISLLIIIFIISFILLFKYKNDTEPNGPDETIEENSVKEKSLTKEEIKIAKYNTVIKLNEINFPTSESNYSYNEEHLNKYYDFTHNFFINLNYTDFSPISLYSILINIYMAISDTELSELLNNPQSPIPIFLF